MNKPRISISVFEGPRLFEKLSQRLEMCLQEGCFNACWEEEGVDGTVILKLVDIKLRIGTIHIQVPKIEDGRDVLIQMNDDHNTCTLACSPLDDAQVFEDFYMYIHHAWFGLCFLKTSIAKSPLDRLEKVEALVEDLMTVMRDEQASKRIKLDS